MAALTDSSWWSSITSLNITDKHENVLTVLIPPLVSMACLHTVPSLNQFSQLVGKHPMGHMHFCSRSNF